MHRAPESDGRRSLAPRPSAFVRLRPHRLVCPVWCGVARLGEVLQCERRHLLSQDDLFHSANAVCLRLGTSAKDFSERSTIEGAARPP